MSPFLWLHMLIPPDTIQTTSDLYCLTISVPEYFIPVMMVMNINEDTLIPRAHTTIMEGHKSDLNMTKALSYFALLL